MGDTDPRTDKHTNDGPGKYPDPPGTPAPAPGGVGNEGTNAPAKTPPPPPPQR